MASCSRSEGKGRICSPHWARAVLAAIPLPEEDKELLLTRFTSVSYATLKGTAVVGVIQGVIGGVLFWALSLHPLLLLAAILGGLAVFGLPGRLIGPVIAARLSREAG